MTGSTRDETYRAVVLGRTPDNAEATMIITRQGLGRSARVWITLAGSIRCTIVLSDPQSADVAGRIQEAARR